MDEAFSKLAGEGVVFLGGVLDDDAAASAVAQLVHLEYDRPEREISVYLNCSGGSLSAAFAVHDVLEYVAPDVLTVALGEVTGPAVLLLACGTPGRRLMQPGAHLRLTEPALRAEGDSSALAVEAAELARTTDRLVRTLARHTGRPEEELRALSARGRYLDAEEAVRLGFADRVAHPRPRVARAGVYGRG